MIADGDAQENYDMYLSFCKLIKSDKNYTRFLGGLYLYSSDHSPATSTLYHLGGYLSLSVPLLTGHSSTLLFRRLSYHESASLHYQECFIMHSLLLRKHNNLVAQVIYLSGMCVQGLFSVSSSAATIPE